MLEKTFNRQQFLSALMSALGESNHKVARWTQGAEPFYYWSAAEIELAVNEIFKAPIASKITEEVAGDLSEQDKAKIDAAWERHKRAGSPDWPPSISAIGLRDGTLCRGSTGQIFEARDGQWVRLFLDHNI